MKKILLSATLAAAFLSGGAQAASFYLTIAGIGGEPDYETRFGTWTSDAAKALATEQGAKVETLTGASSTKENIKAKLASIASQTKADDTFVLLLVGHGSFDDIDYKFNIPGSDLSASELALALDRIQARQLVVLATSASGGAIDRLKKDKRVVIAATKSGAEKNATLFGRFWVESLRDPAADGDKNGTVTALEAYNYTQTKTQDFYKTQKRLATEHSVLEDTGKKDAEQKPTAQNGQGLVATRFPLMRVGSAASVYNDPVKAPLVAKREQLETQIDELKYRKAALDEGEYNREFRRLMTELARVQADLDK
jgi:hypothetical protein